MAAKDLGNKFTCFNCGAKFYDMKKPDPICPKCGKDQRESPALRPQPEGRRGRLSATPKVIEPLEVEEPETPAEEEEEVDSFEDEEDVETGGGDDDDL